MLVSEVVDLVKTGKLSLSDGLYQACPAADFIHTGRFCPLAEAKILFFNPELHVFEASGEAIGSLREMCLTMCGNCTIISPEPTSEPAVIKMTPK
jgi:hypothetical protein